MSTQLFQQAPEVGKLYDVAKRIRRGYSRSKVLTVLTRTRRQLATQDTAVSKSAVAVSFVPRFVLRHTKQLS